MARKKIYPFEIELKLLLVECAKPRILHHHFVRIRREIRKDPSITREEVGALIEAAKRMHPDDWIYEATFTSGRSRRISEPGSAFDDRPVFEGRDWSRADPPGD